ncbi:uncharacterized protein TNCT_171301 [Trichonephila clavata]|nr:uncharacterized protein TNCT_20721 [Trichonephila clavata]GFR25846.1 uncharacterized protein TNCT_171301 [Trichonephila clavata]
MNLIDTNWREILQNSTLYKKHENENLFGDGYNSVGTKIAITKQYIQDAENCFDVLVVGYFKNTKENTIKQSQCKPLEEIGKVLCKKSCLPSNFFMESCHGMCPSCRKFDALRDNKWCLKDTKVFTPEGIKSASKDYIQAIFKTPSLAIVRVCINMKYNFSSFIKIGGRIKSIIFIKENLLRDSDDMSEVLTLEKSHCVPTRLPENGILAIPEKLEYEVQSSSLTKS